MNSIKLSFLKINGEKIYDIQIFIKFKLNDLLKIYKFLSNLMLIDICCCGTKKSHIIN